MREVAYVKGLWLIFYFTDCHRQSYRQWLVRIFNSWYHNKNHTASDCSCLSTRPARWDLADDRLLCHERQCDCKRELWTQFGQTTGMFQLNCCKLTLTYGERARWTAKWPRISFFFFFRKSSGEQLDSSMRWIYSLKHHTWRHTCGRNKKKWYTRGSLMSMTILPHFDVICDLSLNRPTTLWNLFRCFM